MKEDGLTTQMDGRIVKFHFLTTKGQVQESTSVGSG